MTVGDIGPLLAVGISFVTNFRRFVNVLSGTRALSVNSRQPIILPSPREQGDNYTMLVQRRRRPHLRSTRTVASTSAEDIFDEPRAVDITPTYVGPTVDATALFSADPKLSVTIQPLPALRPSPPRFLRWMLEHFGGGRFRPIDIGRPGPERLAVLYVDGGCDITDNDETGEPWSPRPTTSNASTMAVTHAICPSEADVVDELGLNIVSRRIPVRYPLDVDLAPEHLKKFERRIAKRIRGGRLDELCPLKRAVHNCLARVVDLKVGTKQKERTDSTSTKRSRNHSRTSSFKLDLEGTQQPRRSRPTIQPLDMEAARARVPTTDSPPESPAPTTPVDSHSMDSAHILEEDASEEFLQVVSIQQKS